MEIGFNKDTAAWVGVSLSIILAFIQLGKDLFYQRIMNFNLIGL